MSRPNKYEISDLRHRIYEVRPGDLIPEQHAVFTSTWGRPTLDGAGRPRSRSADLRCLKCGTEFRRTYEAIVQSVIREAISCPECRRARLRERHWLKELKRRGDTLPIVVRQNTRPCTQADVLLTETERLAHCKPWR